MITKGYFKDRPAILVESNNLIATFLNADGGKLASLKRKHDGKEFLLVKENKSYKILCQNDNYVNSECSGFDDMFPTVDPYINHEEYEGIEYPDHGECCRIAYNTEISQDKVVFYAQSKLFNINYSKTVSLLENGGISIKYCIENLGTQDFPSIWAGHIMLQGEEDMVLETPFSKETKTKMMFCTKGIEHSMLPKNTLMGYEKGKGAAYKFYYLEKIPKGFFDVVYSDGYRLCFQYDEDKLPYLGVWLNNGEFQDIYTITPEPCTAPFDCPNLAEESGLGFFIPKNSTFDFELKIFLERCFL